MRKRFVGFDKSVSILDVGPGRIPFSSILLAKDGYDVTAMDNFHLSDVCLSGLNVKSYRQFFNEKTNIKGFDVVVGRKPCSAIDGIVSACKGKTPYFMKMCPCETPNNNISYWKDILPGLDKGVKFYKDYAYNLVDDKYGIYEEMSDIIDMEINNTCM